MKLLSIKNKTIFEADVVTMKELVKLANLQGANLQYANLWCANLQDANFRGANLRHANLQGANLQYANLQGANLRHANLRSANLQGANLRGANLQDANLDFSSGIPYRCGGTQIKVDDRIVSQMLFHLTRQNTDYCSGGVQEAIEQIKKMAVSDLFCEYRIDVKRLGE